MNETLAVGRYLIVPRARGYGGRLAGRHREAESIEVRSFARFQPIHSHGSLPVVARCRLAKTMLFDKPARGAVLTGLTLTFAAAFPLASSVLLSMPIYPPAVTVVARDWALLLASAGVSSAILAPLCAGFASGSSVVALGSLLIGMYPLAVMLGNLLGLGTLEVDLGLIACVVLFAAILRRQTATHVRSVRQTLTICCMAPCILVAALSLPRYVGGSASWSIRPPDSLSLSSGARPNIYQIVVDELGRPDVLEHRYGLNLEASVSALQARGFTVSRCASANYAQTYLTLASMLNMDYLHNLGDLPRHISSRIPAHRLITHNRVESSLRSLGYRVVWIGSGYSATANHSTADRCVCGYPWVGEFEGTVLSFTALGRLLPQAFFASTWARFINDELSVVRNLPKPTQATFTFVHIMSPHPPFVFGPDGSITAAIAPPSFRDGSGYPGTPREYVTRYASQAAYVLPEVIKGIDHLIDVAPPDSIFIVHGDHGPRLSFNTSDARRSDSTESLATFLAVRWPGGRIEEPEPVTLVNVYRRILSHTFGANLPDLPNRHFMSSFATPYDWVNTPTIPCPDR
jgi:Sulfatase